MVDPAGASGPRRAKLMVRLFQQPATVYHAFYTSALFWFCTSLLFVLGYWVISHFPESIARPSWLQPNRIQRVFSTFMEVGWLPLSAGGFVFWYLSRRKALHPAIIEYIPLAVFYWNFVVLGAFVWNWMVEYPAFRLGIPWILSLALGLGLCVPVFIQNFSSWLFVCQNNIRLTRAWFGAANAWIVIYVLLLFAACMDWLASTEEYSWFWIDFQRMAVTLQSTLFLGLALNSLGGFLSYTLLRKRFLNPSLLVFSFLILLYLNGLAFIVLVWNVLNFGQAITVYYPWWLSLLLFGIFYIPLNYRNLRHRFSEIIETKRKVQYGS